MRTLRARTHVAIPTDPRRMVRIHAHRRDHPKITPPTRGVWCAFMRTGGPPKNHPADPRRRVRIHAPPDTLQSPSFAVTISFTAFGFALPPVAFIT